MNVFLIDADNLNSGAWVDEAFRVLEASEGSFPVRRAYGSADNLKALNETLRAWAVRPFVNLALTKNTTDMALAVDAMELATPGLGALLLSLSRVIALQNRMRLTQLRHRAQCCAFHRSGCVKPLRFAHTIAVETPITECPPHRSVRAQFRHTAPTLGV